jgi:undecaprenyl-diphosphatase
MWATLVSYSRIYLGVHYLSDILAGAAWGILLAFIFYRAFLFIQRAINLPR